MASPLSPPVVVMPPQPQNEHEFVEDSKADKKVIGQLKTLPSKQAEQPVAAKEILRDIDIDQRERARTALHTLQELLTATFDDEDCLELDNSSSRTAQQHFDAAPHGSGFVLTDSTLSKLDGGIASATSTNQISHIPVESLLRLQKMCSKVIASANSEDFVLPEEYSDDSLQRLSVRVGIAQSSLAASRLLLRTMVAGRAEKELYSEESLAQLLSNLKHVADGLVVAIVEKRKSTDSGYILSQEESLIKHIGTMMQRMRRVLKMLGDLLISCDISEMSITTVESICTKLIFVANSSSEKESILGIQKFESLRRDAMDTLARVFLRSPSQRGSILDEILTSLEKLPVARQSARYYSITDAKPIQLVSALLMQLIQTTATRIPEKQRTSKSSREGHYRSDSDRENSSDDSPSKRKEVARNGLGGFGSTSQLSGSSFDQLAKINQPLLMSVQKNAAYIAQYLVGRALKSSKTSDEPYRNLLDIFTEDFVNVLGHTDWPAAEMLLQNLLRQLIHIAENEKSSAPAKNMALDLMGVMGSGIADVKVHLDRLVVSLNGDDDPETLRIAALARVYVDGQNPDLSLISLQGPYRVVTDYLTSRSKDDIQLENARNFHLLQWSQRLCIRSISPATPTRDEKEYMTPNPTSTGIENWLLAAIQYPEKLDTELADHSRTLLANADNINRASRTSTVVARMSYLLVVLNSTFCKAIMRIFALLLQSMASPHATIRSRGLKSVIQPLEKDPSLLDRNANIVKHITRAANDQSTMVRDAALGLIGRCITLRPSTELQFLDTMLTLTSDPTVGIRKRSIRQLRDAYLRNKEDATRIRIASAFLRRMNDEDETLVALARQTLEEIWIQPYPAMSDGRTPLSLQQELNRHATQLIHIAEQSDDVLQAFEPFFHALLVTSHENISTNRGVCKAIASAAFESFIDNDQQKSLDARANILALLSVLARASSTILSLDQLKLLEAYTKTLKTGADLRLYKPVAQIFRATMPCFLSTEREFLLQLQENLVKSISLIPPSSPDLLDEVTSCLWAMNHILGNKEKLANICRSVLIQVDKGGSMGSQKLIRCIKMIGYFGKAWDLDDFSQIFRDRFPWWEEGSVAELIVRVLLPHVQTQCDYNVRQASLESICLTCWSWPKNFLIHEVQSALTEALRSQSPGLELVVVSGLRNFFKLGEAHTKLANPKDGVKIETQSTEKLGSSMISSDSDKAATLLAQQQQADIQRIALRYTNDVAMAATELICSTNRQGLVHPRQSGLVLVALETSPNESIAAAAYEEHLSLNSKHESILEKEYLRAIEQAFIYQRDTIHDPSGLKLSGQPTPKLQLFFEVLKTSTLASRKKLLQNLCKRLDINIARLESVEDLQTHVTFAKFVCQNLAFASYARVDEILIVCSSLESMFGTTGSALSQHVEPLFNSEAPVEVPLERLAQLTLCSLLLCLFWQTRSHLRSITTNLPSGGGKADKRVTKDTSKPPIKSTNAARLEESYVQGTNSLELPGDEQSMRTQCSAFMKLLSIDDEAKIINESDELDETTGGRPTTPDDDRASMGSTSHPPSGGILKPSLKRRRSEIGSASLTPNGKKRGRPKLEKGKSSSTLSKRPDDDDEGWD